MSRVQKLLDIIAREDLDGVALVPGANLRYLTGIDFHLMERLLVVFFVPGQDPVAVVPNFEEARLQESGIPFQTFAWSDTEGPYTALAGAVGALKLPRKRLGVEPLRMRVYEAQTLEEAIPGLKLVPAGEALARLRLHKDESELAAMREAIAISEAALRATLDAIRPGMTEREIASRLVAEQLQRGGGPHPFEPIVLSGPRAALPHGEPGDRAVADGEPLLFDFGTTARGYASDITRTVAVGQPSARLAEVYAAVKAANAAGRAAARSGATAQDVDRAARKAIEDAGFGVYFTHRTGHGLGLEAHEPPAMVEGNTLILEPGLVFTVEPGIYIPGEVGVRIEDNVVITADGSESLTTFPRELITVGT